MPFHEVKLLHRTLEFRGVAFQRREADEAAAAIVLVDWPGRTDGLELRRLPTDCGEQPLIGNTKTCAHLLRPPDKIRAVCVSGFVRQRPPDLGAYHLRQMLYIDKHIQI